MRLRRWTVSISRILSTVFGTEKGFGKGFGKEIIFGWFGGFCCLVHSSSSFPSSPKSSTLLKKQINVDFAKKKIWPRASRKWVVTKRVPTLFVSEAQKHSPVLTKRWSLKNKKFLLVLHKTSTAFWKIELVRGEDFLFLSSLLLFGEADVPSHSNVLSHSPRRGRVSHCLVKRRGRCIYLDSGVIGMALFSKAEG